VNLSRLTNRIKAVEKGIYWVGGSIPKEEQVLVVKAKTESETNKIFQIQKDKLKEKYGDFPDEDVLCVWCMDFAQ
jgi:hypothetical protein